MRNLNVSAAQGYRVERQSGNDRSAGAVTQAEPIVPSRLSVVTTVARNVWFPTPLSVALPMNTPVLPTIESDCIDVLLSFTVPVGRHSM